MSPYLLASSLSPADVGRRVVLRFALPDGQASDVLGELEAWTASELSVRRRDGSVEVIGTGAVLAGKVVPATWARDVASGELERIASDGWPALERVALGSWELRAAAGWTKRANSVLAVGSPGVALDEALSMIKAWYDERGLPTVVQLPLPLCAHLDAELERRGWRAESSSLVLAADLRQVHIPVSATVATLEHAPSAPWLSAHPHPPPVAARGVLTGAPALYSSVTDGSGDIIGIGRGSVVGAWLSINSLWVSEAHRRRGVAQALIRGLTDEVDDGQVRHVFLQVEADNDPACALYVKLGFEQHHSYLYRVAA
ncbi:MAG: N-acetylglutamate synthase [Frankiaceae bacterium]|nr:N-acetylglutamate synthase [Frankiaceae bacterium]